MEKDNPPPEYNFREVPLVRSRMPLWETDPVLSPGIPHGRFEEDHDHVKLGGTDVAEIEYPDDESKMSAHDLGIHLPPPSLLPILLALAITVFFGGFMVHWGITVVAGFSIALLVINASLLIINTGQAMDSNAHYARSYEIKRALSTFQSVITTAESGQRGYLLTGDTEYLTPYYRAMRGWRWSPTRSAMPTNATRSSRSPAGRCADRNRRTPMRSSSRWPC